jgi:hypothetical protein
MMALFRQQFYAGDWRQNAELARKGIGVLCDI